MLRDDLLQELIALDHLEEYQKNDALVDQIDLLDKATQKLQRIKMFAKIKKILSSFEEEENDIYIVTHAKSGTTLSQMILYQMTTDGNMDFDHIYDVSPWLGQEEELPENLKEPRLFKSHFDYSILKHIKKGKFIFIIRDGLDVMNSLYHHHKNYYDSELDLSETIKHKLQFWFDYNSHWLKNESELNILFLNYEDLVSDKENTLKKIANFIEIPLSDATLKRVLERSTFSFMKQHQEKFGEQPEKDTKVYNKFIRKGEVGDGQDKFPAEEIERYKKLGKDYFATHPVTSRYFK